MTPTTLSAADEKKSLSMILREIVTADPASIDTLGEIIDRFGRRSFGVVLFVFGLISAVPLPPGFTVRSGGTAVEAQAHLPVRADRRPADRVDLHRPGGGCPSADPVHPRPSGPDHRPLRPGLVQPRWDPGPDRLRRGGTDRRLPVFRQSQDRRWHCRPDPLFRRLTWNYGPRGVLIRRSLTPHVDRGLPM